VLTRVPVPLLQQRFRELALQAHGLVDPLKRRHAFLIRIVVQVRRSAQFEQGVNGGGVSLRCGEIERSEPVLVLFVDQGWVKGVEGFDGSGDFRAGEVDESEV